MSDQSAPPEPTLTERMSEWHASLKAGHTLEHEEQKALMDAVKRVLALHLPMPTGFTRRNGKPLVLCQHCIDVEPQGRVPWPCPTVAALNEALGVDE